MKRPSYRALCALAFLLVLLFGTTAAAQDVVIARHALPLDGQVIDLAYMAPPGEGPFRVVLSGTVTFRPTGTEHDMSGTFAGGSLRETQAFVALPDNVRVVSGNLRDHRYVLEIPRGENAPIHFRAAELATRHYLVASELSRALSGEIAIEVMGPAAPATPMTVAKEVAQTPGLRYALLAVLPLALIGFVFARTWRREDRALMRRARRAQRAVDREVMTLGPAFHHVARFADRLADTSRSTLTHYHESVRAFARAKKIATAGKVLDDLAATRDQALEQLREIVQRLELTAAELASHHASASRDANATALMHQLEHEIETAREADQEARAL